jgi:NAD(P)-dependent dehydrogenase (short-subunit alcohol dehydrogenase family)
MTSRGHVVVTGSSTGIGQACAQRLSAEGFQVWAGVRREEDARRLERDIPGVTAVLLDVADAASIERAAAQIDATAGDIGLAGLVNNAGIAVAGPLEYLPLEDLRRQFDVNVFGAIAVTQAFLPILRRGRGRLVFIGSISGRMAAPFLGPYAASKFALGALCDALRGELAPWRLDVSLVEPGEIATPIWDKGQAIGDQLEAQLPPIARQRYEKAIQALRRVARSAAARGRPPDTVADAVMHALTAPRPNTRYLVGSDAWVRAWLAYLPDRWRDAVVWRAMGLPTQADQE